jgi:hypothetical protein
MESIKNKYEQITKLCKQVSETYLKHKITRHNIKLLSVGDHKTRTN